MHPLKGCDQRLTVPRMGENIEELELLCVAAGSSKW